MLRESAKNDMHDAPLKQVKMSSSGSSPHMEQISLTVDDPTDSAISRITCEACAHQAPW